MELNSYPFKNWAKFAKFYVYFPFLRHLHRIVIVWSVARIWHVILTWAMMCKSILKMLVLIVELSLLMSECNEEVCRSIDRWTDNRKTAIYKRSNDKKLKKIATMAWLSGADSNKKLVENLKSQFFLFSYVFYVVNHEI